MASLAVAFDAGLPHAHVGPLFHVFRLEQPDVVLSWHRVGFPAAGRSLLDHADVGIFVHPPEEPGLSRQTLHASPLVVVMAAGHALADLAELTVVDVIDQPFPGGREQDPEWAAFWTLDDYRGGPPKQTDDDVKDVEQGLDVVASGRAIATLPMWAASGLAHPGVVALPLTDGPQVTTCLVWRTGDDNPVVRSLVELAGAWTGGRYGNGNGNRPG